MSQLMINTFGGGMQRDVHVDLQKPNTYRYSRNGTLVFRGENTFVWSNEKGNKYKFSITQGYTVRGYAEFDDRIVILSHNGTYSEIGDVHFDTSRTSPTVQDPFSLNPYTYRVLFNDKDDPFGERLNLTARCRVIPLSETGASSDNERNIRRIYWTDGINPPRVFDIFVIDSLPAGTLGFPPYPSWYSVRAFNIQQEWDMGFIYFDRQVSGSLLSGYYQYAFRLISETGYATPWSPLTRPIAVVDAGIDGGDWNKYRMSDIQKQTGKGNRLEVQAWDGAYERFEVAAIYSITKETPLEAVIFHSGDVVEGSSSYVEHTSMTGTQVTPESILQPIRSIDSARDIEIKDNILFFGNVKEKKLPLLPDTAMQNIEIKPYFRFMVSDQLGRDRVGIPLTHQNPVTKTAEKFRYVDKNTGNRVAFSFPIVNDYEGYKGIQIDHAFTGYMRGERDRIGLVLYNKLGQPSFVQHIADIVWPDIETPDGKTYFDIERLDSNGSKISQRYYLKWNSRGETEITTSSSGITTYQSAKITEDQSGGTPLFNSDRYVTEPSGQPSLNDSVIRIMGFMVSNIDLTDVKDDISGIAIVRATHDKKTLGQGLLLTAVYDPAAASSDGVNVFRPLPSNYNGANGVVYDGFGNVWEESPNLLRSGFNVFTFECPDFFEGGLPVLDQNHRLRLVGSLYDPGGGFQTAQFSSTVKHFYNKMYSNFDSGEVGTSLPHHYKINTGSSYQPVGYEDNILSLVGPVTPTQDVVDFHPLDPSSFFRNQEPEINDSDAPQVGFGGNDDRRHFGHDKTIVVVAENMRYLFPIATGAGSIYSPGTTETPGTIKALRAPLVNYINENGGNYGGMNRQALASTTYEQIGEFLPVRKGNDPLFWDRIKDPVTGKYVLDGFECYGGYCYLDYYSLARLHPRHDLLSGDVENGIGYVFPVETYHNHMIYRKNDVFAGVGTKPLGASSNPKGFFIDATNNVQKIEDYDAVDLGYQQETLALNTPAPVSLKINRDFPYSIIWTSKKTYGEQVDAFRQIFAANSFDVDGNAGAIAAIRTLYNKMYCIQENGICLAAVNDRELVQTVGGTGLALGSGGVMERIDYITREYGTQHTHSVIRTDTTLYFVDAKGGKILSIGAGGFNKLSDMKGLHDDIENITASYINQREIHGGYDKENGTIYFVFYDKNNGLTLSYNENIGAFVSFHDYRPNIFMSFANKLYVDEGRTVSNGGAAKPHKIYLHGQGREGEFYDVFYDSELHIVSNRQSEVVKTFDNAYIGIEGEGIDLLDRIDAETEINTHTIFGNDSRIALKERKLRFPIRDSSKKDRVRGHAMVFKMKFKNNGGKRITIPEVQTIFRFSRRI